MEFLNLKYPILQGAMAHIATGSFAASVSNAGALGIIGSGGMDEVTLKREIEICKNSTNREFGVNLMMLRPDVDRLLEIILDEDVKIITVGAGSPSKYMDILSKEKVKVLPLVSSPIQAKRLSKSNITAIIAEGMEAGGHIGEMPSMVLIPQVKESTDLNVVAAGGIGSGSQMLCAEILGASAVQIGTGFLFTEECPVHKEYKKALLNATASRVTTVGNVNGMPMRLLKNEMTREYKELEKKSNLETLETFTIGRLRSAVVDGDVKNGSVMTGYTVGQFDKIVPIKDFLEHMMEEYEEAKKCLLK